MQLPHSGLRPGQSLYSFHSPRHPCKKQTHIRPSAVYQQPPAYGNTPPQQQFVTTPSPYPPQQQQPPLQRTIAAPTPAPYVPPAVRADDAVYLGRSQLVNKQVVTRTTGRSLGYISQMYVDTGRLEVVYMDLKPTQLATETRANLLLSSLRQIGVWILVAGCIWIWVYYDLYMNSASLMGAYINHFYYIRNSNNIFTHNTTTTTTTTTIPKQHTHPTTHRRCCAGP